MKYFPKGRGKFNGIINYFNIHHYDNMNSFIKTTSPRQMSDWGDSSKVIDFKITDFTLKTNNWAGQNLKNSSIIISFQRHKVLATHYSILSPHHSGNYLQNWIIEGSNEDEKWHIIDRKENSTYLTGVLLSHTYKLDVNSIFRNFRITQIGRNSGGNFYFHLSRFELFGSLSENDERECYIPLKCTAQIKRHHCFTFILLYTIIHVS